MTIETAGVDRKYRLLIAACGSVGVIALPQYLMAIRMMNEPIEIHVIMSDSAAKIIPLETVSQFCDTAAAPGVFWKGAAMGHIEYAEWPDLIAVAPASCDTLARTAAGLTDKAIPLLALAHRRPVLFFPNMNRSMWDQPPTQRNVAQVRSDGHVVVEPKRAHAFATAAGRFEEGCILPGTGEMAKLLLDELRSRADTSTPA